MDSALAPVWAKVKPAGMFLSGGLFGLGWFVAADALARSALVLHAPVPPTYALPGVVATLALLLIVAVRRADLSSGGDGGGMYDDCAVLGVCLVVWGGLGGGGGARVGAAATRGRRRGRRRRRRIGRRPLDARSDRDTNGGDRRGGHDGVCVARGRGRRRVGI